MSSRHSSWDETAVSNLLGLVCVLAVVALVFLVWLMVKVIQLLVRVFAAHPRNTVLLVTLATSVVLLLVVAVTGGQYQPLDGLAGASILGLLAVALVLDTADDQRLRRSMSRDTAVQAVLHDWWPAA